MLCLGVMSGDGAGAPDLDPSCYLFLPCSREPEGCHVHLLGNLSPFTLRPEEAEGQIWAPEPDFGIPSWHLSRSSPGPGAHPPGAQLSNQVRV